MIAAAGIGRRSPGRPHTANAIWPTRCRPSRDLPGTPGRCAYVLLPPPPPSPRPKKARASFLTSWPPFTPSAPVHTSAGPRKPGTRRTGPARSHANSTANPLLAPSPTVPAARLWGGGQQRYLAVTHGLLALESSRDGRHGRTGHAFRR